MRFADFRLSRHHVLQFFAYMVGGGVYFWSGYAVFALCYSGLHWHWVWAKIAADIIGWTLNYLVQRYWAFNSASLKRHETATIGKYGLLTIFNLALDYAIIWSLNAIGVTPYIGFFISAGFFTVWNYVWYRFWVFYRQTNKKVES